MATYGLGEIRLAVSIGFEAQPVIRKNLA